MDSLFVGFEVAPTVAAALTPIFDHYGTVVEERTPPAQLHVTLLWLDSAPVPPEHIEQLCKPLPQSFVPTIRLTHVGRGQERNQLWAFVEPTGPIMAIRQQLVKRLAAIPWELPKPNPRRAFVPHIAIASLYDQLSHIGVADVPFVTSYAVNTVILYKNNSPLTHISLL